MAPADPVLAPARRGPAVLPHLVRGAVAACFLVAAVQKLRDPAAFAGQVGRFGLVWDDWVGPAAWAVLAAEGAAAALLLLGRPAGWCLAAGLLLLFIPVLGYGLAIGLDVDCGCFGPDTGHGLAAALAIDLFLLGLAGLGYFLDRRRPISRPRS